MSNHIANESPRAIVSRFLVALDHEARAGIVLSAGSYFQDVAKRVYVKLTSNGRANWYFGGDRISYSDLHYYLVSHAQRRIDEHAAKEANARLIAAAPELLAALRRATEFLAINCSDAVPATLLHCRAALAKAGVQS